jgi:hypothetical protein
LLAGDKRLIELADISFMTIGAIRRAKNHVELEKHEETLLKQLNNFISTARREVDDVNFVRGTSFIGRIWTLVLASRDAGPDKGR